MKTGISEAALLTLIMSLVILFCRAFPFLFFRRTGGRAQAFIGFIEKIVPPLAMTVLTFNAISSPIMESVKQISLLPGSLLQCISPLSAAAVTVIAHLWRRNALISIFSGTAVYMALERFINI